MENYYQQIEENDLQNVSVKERIQNLNKLDFNIVPSKAKNSKNIDNKTTLNHNLFSHKQESFQNTIPVKSYSKNYNPSCTYVDLSAKNEKVNFASENNSPVQNPVVKQNLNINKNIYENLQTTKNTYHKFENMEQVHLLLQRKYWWENCKFVFLFIVLLLSILIITIVIFIS